MDIKTLEYLEKRAEKGRKVVNTIQHLERMKEATFRGANSMRFFPEKSGPFDLHDYNCGSHVISNILETVRQELEKEIEILKEELHEL